MSQGRRIFISRDKRSGSLVPDHLHLWYDDPEFIREGKGLKMFHGNDNRIAVITLKQAKKLGDEFVVKPGETKPVMMTTF